MNGACSLRLVDYRLLRRWNDVFCVFLRPIILLEHAY